MFYHQSKVIKKHRDSVIRPIGINPKFSFLHLFRTLYYQSLLKEALLLLWYLTQLYTIAIEFPTKNIQWVVTGRSTRNTLRTFLEWFSTTETWKDRREDYIEETYIIFLFHRPYTNKGFTPTTKIYTNFFYSLYESSFMKPKWYKGILTTLCIKNKVQPSSELQAYKEIRRKTILRGTWTNQYKTWNTK